MLIVDGIVKGITEALKLFSLTSSHIFGNNYDYSKIKGEGSLRIIYGVTDKKRLARMIFMDFLNELMNHIVETGDKFKFPSQNYSTLYIEEKPDWEVQKALQAGVYSFTDPFFSDFKLYNFVMTYTKGKKTRKKIVLCDKELYKVLCDKVLSGKRYFEYEANSG